MTYFAGYSDVVACMTSAPPNRTCQGSGTVHARTIPHEERDETMATIRSVAGSRKAQVLAAFLAVYLIWGSTYLAVRFAVETLPAVLLPGTRFLRSGAVLS